MANRRPLPETQRHLTEALIKPETQQTSYTAPDFNRGYETAASSEDPSPLTVTLENLDTAVDYYFKNVIKPVVIQNGTTINVPIYYGSPERWTSIQKNGFIEDVNGDGSGDFLFLEGIDKVVKKGIEVGLWKEKEDKLIEIDNEGWDRFYDIVVC